MKMQSFWYYFGAKQSIIKHYPTPNYNKIVEPFAGSASYSLAYSDLDVTLVEKYCEVAEIWRYLITVGKKELKRIPNVESVGELPEWVPYGGRALVGFCLGYAIAKPQMKLSAGARKNILRGRKEGWTDARKEKIANQLSYIRHWKIISGSYENSPRKKATWFIDPPYAVKGSSYYHGSKEINYSNLADWCVNLKGQVIVCENEGANWLPFKNLTNLRSNPKSLRGLSREMVWLNETRDS